MDKRNKIIFFICAYMISAILGLTLSLYIHRAQFQGTTHTVNHYSHQPTLLVQKWAGDKHAGQKIFQEFCSTCHARTPNIDTPAPRIGDHKRWQTLRQLGLNHLLTITIHGTGVMPPRGGCFECNDQQLKASIQYMLAQSQ